MKRSSILPVLLLFAFTACDANDADTDAEAAASGEAAGATATGSAAADLGELRDYELTMDRIDRFFEAQLNVARAASRMTPAERDAMADDASDSANASLDDMAANIERHPVVRDAIEDAGLSPREYATLTMAMMQAGMAMSILAMRPNDDQDSLMREMNTNPENVQFLRENIEALTQKQQAAAAEMERLFPEESEE